MDAFPSRFRVVAAAAAMSISTAVLAAPQVQAQTPDSADVAAAPAVPPAHGLVRPVRGATVRRNPEPGVVRSQRVVLDASVLPQTSAQAAAGVELPLFPDTTVVAELEPPTLALAGYQTWHGTVAGSEVSSVVFVEHNGVLIGFVADDSGRSYRLRPDGSGGTISEQIDSAAFVSRHPHPIPASGTTPEIASSADLAAATSHSDHASLADHASHSHDASHAHHASQSHEVAVAAAPLVAQAEGTGPVIDVLVAYSTAAKDAKGGQAAIEADIALAVEQSNQAFTGSGINASLRLVHAVEVPTNGDATSTDLGKFQAPNDGWNDSIHALRDNYGADIAAMIVDDNANTACGIAYQMAPGWDNIGFAQWGFSVTDVHCSTGYLTFAHEIGHNFGAAHDRGAWSGTPAYSYGYDWVDDRVGQKWRTVMSYANACSGCARLARFSNPDLTHNGAPMGAPIGAPNEADNRALINLTGSLVSSFRGTAPPASLTVTSPATAAEVPAPGTHTIGWSSTGNIGSTVKIDLLRGTDVVSTLATAAPAGTGTFAWVLPAKLERGDNYRIRVTSNAVPTVTAATAPFAVTNPALVVTSHTAPQTWAPGTPQTVTWAYTGTPTGRVKIELVREERVVKVITKTAPVGFGGTGSFAFVPPTGLGDYAGFRIRATLTSVPTSAADSAGTITHAGSEAVRLTSHNDGPQITAGSTQTFTWTTAGTVGPKVRLEILKGNVLVKTIATGIPVGAGEFTWTTPTTLATGSDYRMRVSDAKFPLLTDSSDLPFSVDGTSITVTGPSTSSAIVAGVPVAVTWSTIGVPGAKAKIELVPAVGRPVTVASGAVLSAGTISWSPPLTLVPGVAHRFRATVAGNKFVTDTSDSDTLVDRPSVTVTAPATTDWVAGKPVTINWQFSDGATGPVSIQLLRGTKATTVGSNKPTGPDGIGSFTWTPPVSLVPAGDYQLKIFASKQKAVTDLYEVPISVRRPDLSVVAPAVSTTWTLGAPVEIAWAVSDSTPLPVNLYLVLGTKKTTIKTNVPTAPDGTGSYTWTPPLTLPKTPGWQVLVAAKAAPAALKVLGSSTITTQ